MPTDATTTDFPLPRRAGAYTFASLFAVESFVRSLNSTVISLQAYDILGAAQKVSMLSTVGFFRNSNSIVLSFCASRALFGHRARDGLRLAHYAGAGAT